MVIDLSVIALMLINLASQDAPLVGGNPLRIADAVRREVYISDRSGRLGWRLRLPERLLADPSELLIDHGGTPLHWRQRDGFFRGSATTDEGIRLGVVAQPAKWGIHLEITLTNGTRRRLENVVAHVCLSHDFGRNPPTRFRDPTGERTYVPFQGRLQPIAKLSPGLRRHVLVRGARPIGFFSNPARPEYRFWGKLAELPVDAPFICTQDEQQRATVAFFWDQGAEVFHNGDEPNRCIHVDPSFGNLGPNQQMRRQGGIALVSGSPEEAWQLYQRWRQQLSATASGQHGRQ